MSDGKQGPPHGPRDAPATNSMEESAVYELCNVFGTPTGRRIVLGHGDALPAAPNGWSWRQLPT